MSRSHLALSLIAALVAAACGGDPAAAPGDDATPDVADTDALTAEDGDETDTSVAPAEEPIDLVDPFVGTGASLLNFGALFPGPKLPFGMVALSPDTDGFIAASGGAAHAGGYLYQDTEILGFSHIHLAGTGVGDYGNLLVLPAVGDPATLVAAGRLPALPLDHAREAASPGYYRLDTDAVTSELTASARTGVHRYTFAPTHQAVLFFDVTHAIGTGRATDSHVTVDPTTGELSGFVHNYGDFSRRFDGFDLFFVAVPSRAPTATGTWDTGGYVPARAEAGGTTSGAALVYDATSDPTVELRVGISFVDVAGARANLAAETAALPFDDVLAQAAEAWRTGLSVVTVEGGTDTRRRLFYTALYHAQLMPTLLTDVDGRYRGIDKAVHTAEGFTYYSDFSLWDTYRTFHPLASLLWPDKQRDFLQSLVHMAADAGAMPTWPLATGETGSMIGTSADVVFGDAVDKGIPDVDWASAYAAMRAIATAPAPPGKSGRDDFTAWDDHHYVPSDMAGGSVSKTLEYAHDDFCLATLAAALGEDDDRALFAERAGWWANLWDADGGFLAPRRADGTVPDYGPEDFIDAYVEGTAWQYLFMVPHDAPGLAAIMGGPAAFTERLSTFMGRGRSDFIWEFPSNFYYQGNEPDLVAPWLFGFGGRPELTRFWTTWVADTMYALESWGLDGNDDGGTLSSWYVFAGLGFYPLTCTGDYALSSPLFDRVVVHRASGDVVITVGADATDEVRLDGAPHPSHLLPYTAIANGAALELPPPPADGE
ncbi:MAG: hypothetical protein CVU56_29165 [Deltaproteobacteria bacterium HGW-Deltaproteobacteria-14]|jgi:predicted alpha-1,2-mannosidase|nr:MAG: hypothetical protein CVU56_29165 [Deltaproteobacteria bacterium HGW-Deltaproteobacteria-14]PKQ17666.1 MAG: hypothetical protein CVT68_07350 [Actinobacteria bacterium HGW-Actinobacteria-8]